MSVSLAAATPHGGPALTFQVISLAVLVFILYRQCQARPVRANFRLPVLVTAAGGIALVTGQGRLTSLAQAGILAVLLVGDAIGLGALRAWTMRLWPARGTYLRQATWLTISLWLAGLAIHETVDIAAHIPGGSLLFYLGVTWVAQQLVLQARVRRLAPPPARLLAPPPANPAHGPEPAADRSAGHD
jgi:hypothetical protein